MPPSTHSSTVLAPFQSLFSAPTWRKVKRLIVGTLLARGRRTVTAALRHTGQGNIPSFSLYHHVLNRARWSALKGSRRLLTLLVQTFGTLGGTLTFVIDETLERRWGPRLRKRRHYRDVLASSRQCAVTTSGLRWIVLALVITPPWSRRCWALPVLSLPAPTPRSAHVFLIAGKKRGKTMPSLNQVQGRLWTTDKTRKLMGLRPGIHWVRPRARV